MAAQHGGEVTAARGLPADAHNVSLQRASGVARGDRSSARLGTCGRQESVSATMSQALASTGRGGMGVTVHLLGTTGSCGLTATARTGPTSVRWRPDGSGSSESGREVAEGMGSRVELFEQIRRDRDREGLSIRALAARRASAGGAPGRWRRRCRRRSARRRIVRRSSPVHSYGRVTRATVDPLRDPDSCELLCLDVPKAERVREALPAVD
jgi:hypothetical protein